MKTKGGKDKKQPVYEEEAPAPAEPAKEPFFEREPEKVEENKEPKPADVPPPPKAEEMHPAGDPGVYESVQPAGVPHQTVVGPEAGGGET